MWSYEGIGITESSEVLLACGSSCGTWGSPTSDKVSDLTTDQLLQEILRRNGRVN